VLVVDGQQINQEVAKLLFSKVSLTCTVCTNGVEAIEFVQNRAASGKPMYRLILMDYTMPLCDGPTATSAI
jgi:CheY-like chemotaxis protein